jgi:hypothetical protein
MNTSAERRDSWVTLAALGAALILGLSAAPVEAQVPGTGHTVINPGQQTVVESREADMAAYERERGYRETGPERSATDRARDRRFAQTAAGAAETGCDVTEASLMGQTIEGRHRIYEVACTAGTGFIVIASEPPRAYDCVGRAGYAATARAADPEAELGLQCTLEANQNTVQLIAGYAREAGLECEVDQAIATAVGAYEIGCANRDGWLLDKTDAGWAARPCWVAALKTPGACLYSTPQEAMSQWPVLTAGSNAAACVPAEVAWMGDSGERGSFYEIRCGSGEGVIVRFRDDAPQQTYSCIDAPQIFNRPCELTAAAAASGGRA